MPTYRETKAGQGKFYNLCCPPFEPGDVLAKSILTAIVYQDVFKPTPQTVFPQSWSPGWRALYHFPLPVAPTLKLYGSSSCTDKISLAASCPGLRDRWQCLEGIPFPSLFVNCSPGPRTVRCPLCSRSLCIFPVTLLLFQNLHSGCKRTHHLTLP